MDSITLFKWPITDVSKLAPGTNHESNKFGLVDSNVKLSLQLEIPAKDGGDNDRCALRLILRDLTEGIVIRFKLWTEDIYGTRIQKIPIVGTHFFCNSDNQCGINEFFSFDDLQLLQNDLIIICCELICIEPTNEVLSPSEVKLREKLYSLHEHGITGDCVLKVENQSFKVSKLILMAHSEVFERTLSTEMKEEEAIIRIDNVRPEAMQQFIKYLHLKKLDTLDNFVQEMFILADRYFVESLRIDCVKSLTRTLNKDNIIERLQLAFVYNIVELKNYALSLVTDYSFDGNFQYILQSNEWRKLSNENKNLVNEIINAVFEKNRLF